MHVFSQENQAGLEGILYRKERSFGISANTRGYGISFRKGQHLTGKSQRLLDFDLLVIKHPKEIKTLNQYYDNPKSFVYGKLNSLTSFRAGLGWMKVLYQKEDPINIEVRYNLCGGASLGFAKPVYLYVLQESSDPYNPNRIIVRYDADKYPIDVIYGKAPLGYGLEKTKIHPGVYIKTGMSFDWAYDDDKVRCLEIGLVADYYPKAIQIMAYNQPNSLFTLIYANFNFGRKWN